MYSGYDSEEIQVLLTVIFRDLFLFAPAGACCILIS
jgi:hypothetical protein